jgi:hypothetical protein
LKKLSVFNWITAAFIFLTLVAFCAGFVMQAVLVARLNSANALPYLVDVITIPKYLIIATLAFALRLLLQARRRAAYWLILATFGFALINGLFSLGKWYQAAEAANPFEYNLAGLMSPAYTALVYLLLPIAIVGLFIEGAKRRKSETS